jgi:hypothetical protein
MAFFQMLFHLPEDPKEDRLAILKKLRRTAISRPPETNIPHTGIRLKIKQ